MLFDKVTDEKPRFVTVSQSRLPTQKLARALEIQHSVTVFESNKIGVMRSDQPVVYYRLVTSEKLAQEQACCRTVEAEFAIRDLRGLRMIG